MTKLRKETFHGTGPRRACPGCDGEGYRYFRSCGHVGCCPCALREERCAMCEGSGRAASARRNGYDVRL
jgi:hypothetical protein